MVFISILLGAGFIFSPTAVLIVLDRRRARAFKRMAGEFKLEFSENKEFNLEPKSTVAYNTAIGTISGKPIQIIDFITSRDIFFTIRAWEIFFPADLFNIDFCTSVCIAGRCVRHQTSFPLVSWFGSINEIEILLRALASQGPKSTA
jgi:hypothetical protein